jgi:hypothetical protein
LRHIKKILFPSVIVQNISVELKKQEKEKKKNNCSKRHLLVFAADN